ncbi:hypothetical protein SUGI_0247080 [Cryptomeria japonica]|uniref:kinesin-like protein KIN-4A n=1 Tax=Cryptomeria japonica TaxID=3369 RepID=UPI002408C45B|nr:kinesin-like protein KIN-4A [Cryptomeria japonica]XP_057823711.2 kinesin-like protein KIN-4A [Cryptomeria japonica]GLJ15113.1 hypothetical protein SUGI_0247080 [Cryptomeria japonica]
MDGNGNNHDGSTALARGLSNLSNDGGAEKDIMQCVQVAVHIRPLINHERLQGCKECITVIPGEPQVQIGTHSFTFDHVYGCTGSPSSAIFEECVAPLVDGLFQGYNATVLAYGQTGSGKTYTMGTAYTVGGNTEGVIPKVMEAIFKKVEELKHQGEVLLKVSFIEILKEEIHDLLEANHSKGPIQIREKSNGGITLTNAEEVDVTSQEEMADVLAQGSLCRATGSTNMNQQSSRSHAIFTINMVNKRKSEVAVFMTGDSGSSEEQYEEIVCAKLHLVDLAGSERAKRTGADGLRFKEGVHINKGLLALGNVISALGDEKKRKEGSHVPYRDSKLTRLLQDSLGGNSRTVMIACVSPADTNAEETLNTLKYANRARNIQNKAIVNRNPMAAEMQKMRHQLEYLQAELLCSRNGAASSDELQVLNHKISRLEASNAELRQELQECRLNSQILADHAMEAQVEKDQLSFKIEQLRNGKTWKEIDDADQSQDMNLIKNYLSKIQDLENEVQRLQAATNIQSTGTIRPSSFVDCLDMEDGALVPSHDCLGEESREGEEEDETAKELEHSYLQDTMGKELQELDKRLEQKEAEMKMFAKADTSVLRQHFEKKFMELEEEKRALQKEMERLKAELESISSTSDEHTQKMQESYIHKLKALETQISELKKRQENQAQLLKQKQKSDEAAKRLQEEIQRIKTHRVQLQHKMKQESEQFRFWKASREKELLQLKKEGRRNEYEMHKLQALHQRQKMVLQRKTEEAAMVTKRLKEILEARKVSSRDNTGGASGTGQTNGKALQHSLEQELEVVVRVHEVRAEYEKQSQSRAEMAKELAKLKQVHESGGTPSGSPSAREARMKVLEEMLNNSSAVLVNMASQLSEAEERERNFIGGRGRWNQLRSMGDAKVLLSYLFNIAASSRCQLQDKEIEIREMKINLHKLSTALRQSDAQREELEKKLRSKEQVSLDTRKHSNDLNLPEGRFASKQLQNQACFVDISNTGNENFPYDLRKASRVSQSYNFAHNVDIDILEQEDMDTSSDDQSDEESDVDWAEDLEQNTTMKKNKVFMGSKGSKPLDRKSSGSVGSDMQDNESSGHSQGEAVCGENEIKSKSETEGCCTCSRVSGCKTMKCGCKAAGSFCGPRCGCKANRCANRENMEMEVETSTMDDVVQMEVAESVETLGENKAQRRNHDKDEIKRTNNNNNIGDGLIETKALAVHGASLLENALKESLSRHEVHADSNREQEGENEQNVGHRKPLTDIGNTNVASQDQANSKANQRKKWKKPQIQIVEIAPQSNAQPKETSTTTTNAKLVVPGNSLANNTSLPARPVSRTAEEPSNNSVQESAIPLKLPRSMHKGTSAMTSPLKTRNTSASDESGVDKSAANGPGSPGKCGRGMNGKENLRSN